MYYVYVLQSNRDKKLYYGFTKDLAQRFEEHKNGLVKSTENRRPLKVIYCEACIRKGDALNRERYLKLYRGRQFLQKRLKSYFTGLKK